MALYFFGDPKKKAQVAVVIPTVVRDSIYETLESVFAQTGVESISIMIGVDVALGDLDKLLKWLENIPSFVSVTVLALPYSTSVRHGGVHIAMDCGALRPILTLMANSSHVAYLDDDNTWAPNHLCELLSAVKGKVWAFSHRYLVDEDTGENYGIDSWHSVGVGKGDFVDLGGFVDTNCLMVDTVGTAQMIGRWASCETLKPGKTSDRFVFQGLPKNSFGEVKEPTVFYKIRSTNILHRRIRESRLASQ